MVSAEQPLIKTPGTLEDELGELQMTKGPLDPTYFPKAKNMEDPNRR